MSLSTVQQILLLNFGVLLVHEFEEYEWPGGLPTFMNEVVRKSDRPDRYPLNQLNSLVINVPAAYAFYLVVAAVLVPLFGAAKAPWMLLVLGPFVAFFGTGFFSGFAAIASELFPTSVRATAMGVSYNVGRGLSAFAPFAVGAVAEARGLGSAFLLVSLAFLGAASLVAFLPETRGAHLA